MKRILSKLSKETRCYILSALMIFDGFEELDYTTEIRGEMHLDILHLTKSDVENFAIPSYAQIVAHIKSISDHELRDWIITNTYSPVLKSRRNDALQTFLKFCSDLGWDAKEIKDTMKTTEELWDLKPMNYNFRNVPANNDATSGCFSTIAIFFICIAIITIALQ